MLVRTKRVTAVHNTRTPFEVGPGAYDSARGVDNSRISYAPFSSSTERGIEEDPAADVTPSAGEYQPVYRPSPTAAVSSTNFVSRVPRFRNNQIDSPGPGAYRGESNTWLKGNARPRQQKRGKVQWVKVHKAPSIPSHAQSYGYEENKTGDLILQHPPSLGHTGTTSDMPGVGEYFTEKPVLAGHSPFAGTNFGRGSDRSYLKKPNFPGPGAYTFDFKPTRKTAQTSTFRSKVGRTSLADNRPIPGPGHYEGVRSLSAFSPKASASPTANRYQNFGSSVQRGDIFVTKEQRVIPGPGQYENKLHSTLDADDALIGQAKASFNHKMARFADLPPDVPGPGQYETEGLKKSSFGRAQTMMGTTKRFDKDPPTALNPGPGTYTEKKLVAPIKLSGVFASKSGRFKGAFHTETPAAANYNYTEESISAAAKKQGTHQSSNFQSRVKRHDMTDVSSFKDLYKRGLGPGKYKQASHGGRAQSQGAACSAVGMQSANPRFMNSMSSTQPTTLPAPGLYDRDATKSSLLKRSYNITVGI